MTNHTAALRHLLNGRTFADGAVLVQIPQVPPALVEPKVAANRGYFAYPPQALFYLSAVCTEHGWKTQLVDLNFQVLQQAQQDDFDAQAAWQKPLEQAIAALGRPLVCLSFMFDPTFPQLKDICQYLRQQHPDLCIAIGGVAATADPTRLLDQGLADLVFSNEGEGPLGEFIRFVGNATTAPPHNLSFRDADGAIVQTPHKVGGKVDIDIRSQFDRLPLGDYHKFGSLNNFSRMRGIDQPYATALSRRGCRARCTFCSVRNFNGPSVRVRHVPGVVEEMKYLRDHFGVRHFDWLDDDLLYHEDDAMDLFRAIARELPDITWAANNGLIAAAISEELLAAMRDSGCIGFTVGLETGNPEMLRKVRKPATVNKFRAFAQYSKRYPQLFYIVNFILGLPQEKFGQMLDSFTLAYEARLDWNNFFTFQPLKNTDAWITYGGMDDGANEESLKTRGTTANFNPVRGGVFKAGPTATVATGYDIFDLNLATVPTPEQRNEIWFTFNYIVNFLRMPALTSEQPERMRNALRWLAALGTAYAENPTIDCVRAYLLERTGDSAASAQAARAARDKFALSSYWQQRDQQFCFTALLEKEIPAIDPRAARLLEQVRCA